MTKHFVLLVGRGSGVKHALKESGGWKPLCAMSELMMHDRDFGTPTCKQCIKMLDKMRPKQEEDAP